MLEIQREVMNTLHIHNTHAYRFYLCSATETIY